MAFLRRLFGATSGADAPEASPPDPGDPTSNDAEEHEHELEVLRGEQERLDELAQRQLRYADYAWTPPPQGGERRADDADEPRG